MERQKLIYIAGTGRSGTTLLAAILSEIPGSIGVGEPVLIWSDPIANGHCSCGSTYSDCTLWGKILHDHFNASNYDQVDVPDRGWYIRISQTISILLGRTKFIGPAYLEILKGFYSEIYRLSGAKVIIDESKFLPYLYALVQTGMFDLSVIHVVRDPRAVAFSWQRLKKGSGRIMPKFPYHVSARRWLAEQFLYFVSKCFVPREKYLRIRYEDFIEKPIETLNEIYARNGVASTSPFLSETEFQITAASHFICANISIPRQGLNKLYKDFEWQKNMPSWAKLVVTLICWPMMLLYGYPIFQ